MKLKLWAPFILFMFISAALWFGLHKDPHKIDSPLLNKALPEFSAEELYNPQLRMSNADFKGKITLLNVFATWCLACREEAVILMNISKNQHFQLFGLDYRDQRLNAQSWLFHYGNPYKRIIFDPHARLAIDLGVYGTPETFLIDKKGVIRYKHIGILTDKIWHESFEPLLKQLECE